MSLATLQGSVVNSGEGSTLVRVDGSGQKDTKRFQRKTSTITGEVLAISGFLCITASHHITMQTGVNAHFLSIVVNK